MTVPNPNPYASRSSQPVPNPAGPPAGAAAGAYPQQPHQQQPFAQQPYVPPVYDAGPPKPPRPPLTKAAARRARLAGGVGGGITWLGLGITQLCAILLALPLIVGAGVFGGGCANEQDGTRPTAGVWRQTLDWLGSPWGIAIAVGIPLGIVIALLGLWISTRMLRHPDVRRPVGVTWAGFGIAVAATVLLSSLGSITLPFFGGIPFADADLGLDELDPGATDEEAVQEWLAGGGTDLLERFADPAMLLGMLGPWLAVGQLLALIVPIAVSIFTWWWMAHAMRPADDAPDPSATDADAAAASSASAA